MATVSQDGDAVTLMVQARQAYVLKDYAKCGELYSAAVHTGLVGANGPYNAACCHALNGNNSKAFVWLTKAIQAGWLNMRSGCKVWISKPTGDVANKPRRRVKRRKKATSNQE